MPGDDRNPFAALRFEGEWRHYQRLALAAFEEDRRHGRRHTHVVAPPGSGKTLMGVEMVRRIGRRAAVLAPNSAVQSVWLQSAARFCPDGIPAESIAGATPDAPLACLTYQSLCRLDDPGSALGELAETRWAAERAKATGQTPEQVRAEAADWSGAAAERRRAELARIRAALKREVARGGHPLDLAELLSEQALGRLRRLRELGVGTLVLDECHHLASMWGYVVRAAADELGEVHLVGLTATPPEELTSDEADLYAELLGPVDFTVPTPAVVKDGYLAPYQELAWLTEPLDSEVDWLSEHDQRFRDLVAQLHEDEPEDFLSFPGWVITRMRHRERAGTGEAGGEVSWERFAKRRPALARAGVRFLASGGLELPKDAPRGEGYRQPPDLEDWLVLLEDYALRCLGAEPSEGAARRYDAVSAALRDLGFQLTRQGIRRGASDVDRLLTASGAKPIALAEVMACEHDARGDRLRALVLTEAEVASVRRDAELATVLDPGAGTAPRAVLALAEDFRTAPLRPLLVSGRGLRCAPPDAQHLLAGLAASTPAGTEVGEWRAADEDGDGLVRLEASGPDWSPRAWVRIATAAFGAGHTQALVGTRAMLGEGWDAPWVNVLVDLTSTTTGVSVRQMRGRSLRLDPAVPDKVASNWDVVCVAPQLARGTADYERFVRKHLHLHAPTEDGAIEAGPSHVHPELGPFRPPPAEDFAEINRGMRERAAAIDVARERWAIGQPYVGEELRTLVARPRRERGRPGRPAAADRPPGVPVDQRLQGALAGLALAAGAAGALLLTPLIAPAGLLGALGAGAWAHARLGRSRAVLTDAAPLDLAAHALCEAYAELGELTPEAAASLAIEPRASGYLRCSLERATPEESARFAAGLDELLGPVAAPRYLVSRLVLEPDPDAGATGRAMLGRRIGEVRWHAVPAELGRRKARAEVFARAWERWLGPSKLVFTQRSDEGRRALAEAAAQGDAFELLLRDVWR